jgi:type I restriction-modification system DNA methylase subunit
MAKSGRSSWTTINERAVSFSKTWANAKDEESQYHDFIRDFLRVFEADNDVGQFQRKIKKHDGGLGKIDFYWKDKIAIEMKSRGKNLDAAVEQLRGYMECLPEGEEPPGLWMVSDFETIRILQRNVLQGQLASEEKWFSFKTANLKKHVRHFAALADHEWEHIRTDKESVNDRAAKKMTKLHDALEGYGYKGHDLQVFVARLLFCLFADDTGIFPQDTFYHYVKESQESGRDLSGGLAQLFQDLNQPEEQRNRNTYLLEDSAVNRSDFRYINGGLFSEGLKLASFDKKMRQTLLDCLDFDWSQISPAIFGSMFQGVMEDGARREIGAHYTSEENILKLINPLFMDGLRKEFAAAKASPTKTALASFHQKLSSLKFLDPACGCGNFLIIAYRELRRLEHEVIREEFRRSGDKDKRFLDLGEYIGVKVEQFAGIEILPWPCQLAKTGMWLMEHLMNVEASDEFGPSYVRIPLQEGAKIVEGNALRMDWEDVVPKNELSYILGNPPFVGARIMNAAQKAEITEVTETQAQYPLRYKNIADNLDYVAAWYFKAAKYIQGTETPVAFVSSNSICQGEQVAPIWDTLMNDYGAEIGFAHTTFKWSNEGRGQAAVHCVIVGFGCQGTIVRDKKIYQGSAYTKATNISPYLVDAPSVIVRPSKKPLCNVPEMKFGSQPRDGGHFVLTSEEREEILRQEPALKTVIRPYIGAEEFIHGLQRYCIWLLGVQAEIIKDSKILRQRIVAVKDFRLSSRAKTTNQYAKTPAIFDQITQPCGPYILVPRVSSEQRHYIPIGFVPKDVIASDATLIIPNACLYHFGVLTSSVHMAWVKVVCGRLKSDYRYSKEFVYNTFPWPEASDKQKAEIEKLAKGVLDMREKHPNMCLANLYDPILIVTTGLQKAHDALDRAVMKLYGYAKNLPESAIVADLMERYRELAKA